MIIKKASLAFYPGKASDENKIADEDVFSDFLKPMKHHRGVEIVRPGTAFVCRLMMADRD